MELDTCKIQRIKRVSNFTLLEAKHRSTLFLLTLNRLCVYVCSALNSTSVSGYPSSRDIAPRGTIFLGNLPFEGTDFVGIRPPSYYRLSHGMSKFKDSFFMRVSFAVRISQLENNKTDFKKWFQQNVYTCTCTQTERLSLPVLHHLLKSLNVASNV